MLLKSQSASTNWENLEYIRYLTRKSPTNESGETLIYDENVKRQASRPTTWNIVIDGDSSDSVDFGTITGTLQGWIDTGSGWTLTTISTGLSGTVLTFQTGTKYKAFEDDNYYYIVESESTILVQLNKSDYSYNGAKTITSGGIGDLYTVDNTVPLLKYSSDIRGLINCDEGKFPYDYTGTTTNATTYTGRKDFPLTPKDESCWVFPNTTDYIQSPSSLAGVTITDLKGSGEYDSSDFTIDSVNNRIKASTIGAYFVEMTLSNGVVLVFTGNPNNNSDKIYDITNEVIWSTNYADINNNQGTQDVYSHRLVYGFTVQDNGGSDEYVPNATDSSTLTLIGYSISEIHSAGKYANNLISLKAPAWSRASLVGSSNMDFQRSTTDANGNGVKDRILLYQRFAREDDYASFIFNSSVYWKAPYSLSGVTITQVLGSDNAISDFNVDTVNNRIEAASGTPAACGFVLSNGDTIVYAGEEQLFVQELSGGDNWFVTTANIIADQGTQPYYNPYRDGYSENVLVRGEESTPVWTTDGIITASQNGVDILQKSYGDTIAVTDGTNSVTITSIAGGNTAFDLTTNAKLASVESVQGCKFKVVPNILTTGCSDLKWVFAGVVTGSVNRIFTNKDGEHETITYATALTGGLTVQLRAFVSAGGGIKVRYVAIYTADKLLASNTTSTQDILGNTLTILQNSNIIKAKKYTNND